MAAAGAPGRIGDHDVGGVEADVRKQMDVRDVPLQLWEMETDAILGLLVAAGKIGLDAHRRGVEALPLTTQEQLPYYGKWAASMAKQLLEVGALSAAQWSEALGPEPHDEEVRFQLGQKVRVKAETLASRWRRPHLRTPGYVFGVAGVVERVCGVFPNPEPNAFPAPQGVANAPRALQPLYRVRFKQSELWQGYEGSPADTIDVEVYQHWLEEATSECTSNRKCVVQASGGHGCSHHDHDHDHDHEHDEREVVEQKAVDLEGPPCPGQHIAGSLKRALLQAGIITPDKLRAAVEKVETMGKQGQGPRIVARAWSDAAFKERLMKDAAAACLELGINATNNTAPTVLTVVESTSTVHNVIVCTLCSCYPRSILGVSPTWYRSRSYRARMVCEPRALLREFGIKLGSDVEVRVHDSTADLRYMVLPPRPAGTDGWSEEKLAELVTRDSLIGVARTLSPDPCANL